MQCKLIVTWIKNWLVFFKNNFLSILRLYFIESFLQMCFQYCSRLLSNLLLGWVSSAIVISWGALGHSIKCDIVYGKILLEDCFGESGCRIGYEPTKLSSVQAKFLSRVEITFVGRHPGTLTWRFLHFPPYKGSWHSR